MYQAKAAGRRTFMRYDDAMDVAIRRRATVSGALRKVLDRGELRLVYQPRLALSPPRITGVEALLRWTSAEHGEVPPSQFIPLAEESGLILEIGEWVLREACLTLHRWHQHGLDDLAMAVNVSVLQLLRGDFPDVVRRVLADTGVPPQSLELELTESVLMANAEQTAAKLQAFPRNGGFGGGGRFRYRYSSLAYLKRLPITTLRCQGLYRRHRPRSADAAITPRHHHGPFAGSQRGREGVESEAQMRFLRATAATDSGLLAARRGCEPVPGVHPQLGPQAAAAARAANLDPAGRLVSCGMDSFDAIAQLRARRPRRCAGSARARLATRTAACASSRRNRQRTLATAGEERAGAFARQAMIARLKSLENTRERAGMSISREPNDGQHPRTRSRVHRRRGTSERDSLLAAASCSTPRCATCAAAIAWPRSTGSRCSGAQSRA